MDRTFKEIVGNYFTYSALKCNAHYDMAEYYKQRHRLLGMVTVVVTAIVGTSVFASLGKAPATWVQVLAGLLSMAALQTFLGFPDQQAQHKSAASGYGTCRRSLEMLVMKFPSATGEASDPATTELEKIKSILDDLDKASPTLSKRIWDAVRKESDLTKHAPETSTTTHSAA